MAYPTDPKYKFIKDPITEEVNCVKTQSGTTEPYTLTTIPFDKDNTQYQEYLSWVAKGNTAEAAD